MAMQKFMDQTIGGLLPVAPSITRGKPISMVSWIYDYRVDANGELEERARLVWNHNEKNKTRWIRVQVSDDVQRGEADALEDAGAYSAGRWSYHRAFRHQLRPPELAPRPE